MRVPIPLGIAGLYGSQRVPHAGLIRADGIDLWTAGQIEKEGGAQKQTSAALASGIVGLYDWWPVPGTQRTIAVTRGGGAYRDDGVAWSFPTTLLAEGSLTLTQPPMMVACGAETPVSARKLFLWSKGNATRILTGDGSSVAAMAASKIPADWTGSTRPGVACVHQGRQWAFTGHVAYWSTATDHEDFTGSGSGFLPIAPGEGQEIRAVAAFRKMLVVWKDKGIYIIDTSAADPAAWRYDTQSRAVGIAGPLALAAVPDDVLFSDQGLNVHLLSATDVERDAASSDISTPKLGDWIKTYLEPNQGQWVQMGWYTQKRQAWIVVAGKNMVRNTRRLVVDWNDPELGPRFWTSERDTADALMFRLDSGNDRPYMGTDQGHVYRLDEDQRTKDGVGFAATWSTDDLDFGGVVPELAGRRKNFDWLEFLMEGIQPSVMNVNIYVDGVLKTTAPLTFAMTGQGVPLGTFQLDVDRLAGGRFLRRVRRRMRWSGERLRLEGSNSGAGEGFRIIRATIGARVAENLQR